MLGVSSAPLVAPKSSQTDWLSLIQQTRKSSLIDNLSFVGAPAAGRGSSDENGISSGRPFSTLLASNVIFVREYSTSVWGVKLGIGHRAVPVGNALSIDLKIRVTPRRKCFRRKSVRDA